MRFRILVLLAAASAALAARAAEEHYVKRGTPQRRGHAWVEELVCRVPVRPGGRLLLRADVGSVRIVPGAYDNVECVVHLTLYTGREAEASSVLSNYELVARRTDGGAYLSGRLPYEGHRSRSLCVTFDVHTPTRFNLDLETQGGGVEVGKLDGELRAVTAGGDIRTADVTGPVRVTTAGGSIDLGNIGQRVDARTAGGGVHVGDVKGDAILDTSGGEIVAGTIQGMVRARTAGDDIVLRGASGPVVAETAGGQIRLGQCGGNVRAETAGGSIYLDGARGMVVAETAGGSIDLLRLMSAVRARTSAGRILAQISANRNSFAPSHLETSVGDVQVFLPPELPLTIDAVIDEAAGHKILSDFPQINVRGDQEGFTASTVRGHGALQGGGAELNIRTVMGNIEIRKLDAHALMQIKRAQEAFWKSWQERWREHQEHLEQAGQQLRVLQEQQERRQKLIEERQREREKQQREREKERQEDDQL